MASKGLIGAQPIGELKKVLKEIARKYNYGSCIAFEWFKSGDVAILWKHWSFSKALHAPRVYIGGKYDPPKLHTIKPNIFYIWLD